MKKPFVAGLAVAPLGGMTQGSVTSSASAPHKPAKNIVQTAVAAGSFKTLVSLVKQAGLAGGLSGRGRLTVFAPTDAAFAKVPKATPAALAKGKSKPKAVLLYRLVSGKLTAAQVVKHKSLITRAGGTSSIRTRDGKIHVNPCARDQGQRRGIQRRDPRDQEGADPTLTVSHLFWAPPRRATNRGRPYRKATRTTLTHPHPPAGERLRGRRHPVRRVVSLLPVSPILRQTGSERPRWAALPACVEPGLTKRDR